MRWLPAVVAVSLLALAPAVAHSSTPSEQALVVPGASLGPLQLGMTLADANHVIGAPEGTAQTGGPPAKDALTQTWHPVSPPGGPLIATFNTSGRIISVKTYWNVFYQTRNGVHIGLSEQDVQSILGSPQKTRPWSHFRILFYRGLMLTADNDSTVITGIGVIPFSVYAATTHPCACGTIARHEPAAPFLHNFQ